MHHAGPVDTDNERLLDVGAPARAGDDRERTRQSPAEGSEERGKIGDDRILPEQRHVHVWKQMPGTGLLG